MRMMCHPLLQRRSSPTCTPVPGSLSLEFQEAHSGNSIYLLGLGKAAVEMGYHCTKKMQSQKDGNERAIGSHCSSCLSGHGTSGNAGIQVTAAICVFPCQLRAEPSGHGEQRDGRSGRRRDGEEVQWLTICSPNRAQEDLL